MQFKKINKSNERGVALVWVLALLSIMTVFVLSMTFISRQDILETHLHEERLKTYYIALAGVDLGYASLMANYSGEPYINQFLDNPNKSVTDTIDIMSGGTKQGEAVVTLDSVTVESKRWIRVQAVGTLVDGTQSVTSSLRINPDNTEHTIREGFTP
ncbi:MAG: hypothetical protein BGO41_05455 [Clostridiales bacterium 38-18]|mgnify:CR=1 FL=1|nr:MAG: hypothetical protein BGO41_05455 [Clostridiales bacterium 38-18]